MSGEPWREEFERLAPLMGKPVVDRLTNSKMLLTAMTVTTGPAIIVIVERGFTLDNALQVYDSTRFEAYDEAKHGRKA